MKTQIILSLVFFLVHLAVVIVFRLADRKDVYSAMLRSCIGVAVPFLGLSVAVSWGSSGFLGILLTGALLYFTLHQVFLFSIVALARKSISTQMLLAYSRDAEWDRTHLEEEVRRTRLDQLRKLRFAKKEGSTWKITAWGALIVWGREWALKLWGLSEAEVVLASDV